MWNQIYDELYNKVKVIIKKHGCMKFYNEKESLYLDSNASGVGLGAELLQVKNWMKCPHHKTPASMALCSITFAIKSLFNTETSYSPLRDRNSAY